MIAAFFQATRFDLRAHGVAQPVRPIVNEAGASCDYFGQRRRLQAEDDRPNHRNAIESTCYAQRDDEMRQNVCRQCRNVGMKPAERLIADRVVGGNQFREASVIVNKGADKVS